MERLTVIKSRKLAGPASLANILKTVDNIFANRCLRQWSCDFLPRKTPVAQKHRMISCQEKMAFSTPAGLSWDSPPPPTESVRTDGRSRDYYVTTKISRIDRLPNFFSNGAPLAGFARRLRYYTAADQAIINETHFLFIY